MGWLNDLLFNTFGKMLGNSVSDSADLITRWMLLTPKVINFTWVINMWWTVFILSTVMFIIGIFASLVGILFFKKDLKNTLKLLVVISFISGSSLVVSEGIIIGANLLSDGIMSDVLEEEALISLEERRLIYTKTDYDESDEIYMMMRELYDPTEMAGELTIADFSGERILIAAFGGKTKSEEILELYQVFDRELGGEGFFTMIGSMSNMYVIGLMGILRYGILGLLIGGAPFWITVSVFSGSYDPAIGYFNLLVRTIMIQIIFDLAWLFSKFVNSSNEFALIPRQSITNILFFTALVLSIFLWVRAVVKACANPVNLAGDKVREKAGELKVSMGTGISNLGNRFNSDSLRKTGDKMAAVGKAETEIAQERMTSEFDKPTYRNLEHTKNEFEYEHNTKLAKEKILNTFNYNSDTEVKHYSEVSSMGLDQSEVSNVLENSNLNQSFIENKKSLSVDNRYEEEVDTLLKDHFDATYLKAINHEEKSGHAYNNETYIDEMRTYLDDSDFEYKDLINLQVSSEDIKYLKELNEITKEFAGDIHEMPDNQIGFIISDEDEANEMTKLLDFNNLKYVELGDRKTGISILVDSTEYKDMIERSKIAGEIINHSKLNSSGELDIMLDQESEELEFFRDSFVSTGVTHREIDNLWIDSEDKEAYLELLTEFGRTSQIKKKLECINYDVQNPYVFKEITEEIHGLYPGAIVHENEKDNILTVDLKYQEDVNTFIKGYQKRQSYWKDDMNTFYYIDEKLKRMIKTKTIPENSRYMGYI